VRIITLAGVAAIVLLVVGVMLVEEGEVVTLTTVDDRGHDAATGLWIVDIDAASYLRAVSPDSEWLERTRAHPEAELQRGGVTSKVRAVIVPDASVIAAVNRAMRDKYGLVDATVVRLIDHSRAVAIRVEPLELARRATP